MPIKHASSHGLATLAGIILAGLLNQELGKLMPAVRDVTGRWAETVSDALISSVGVRIPAEMVSLTILASALAGAWGMLWAHLHTERR